MIKVTDTHYKSNNGKINMHCCDNMSLMDLFGENYFDLAVVDPPYFKGVANGRFYGGKTSSAGVDRLCSKSDYWDHNIPGQDYYDKLIHISKDQIIWGINYFNFKGVGGGRIIWDKINDSSTFSNCEIASNSLVNGVFIYRELWNGMIKSEKCKRIHPTQKPINLYKWILHKYAKSGFKIIDTHLGSGSMAIACHYADVELTACEIDFNYFEASVKRFSEAEQQISLFNQ